MRALIQVVSSAQVSVGGQVLGSCGYGFLIYVGIHLDDSELAVQSVADRVAKIRLFADSDGKLNLSLADLSPSSQAQMLIVPNFTLYGDPWNGRRPSYQQSASYEKGERLFQGIVTQLRSHGFQVAAGEFGADMTVESVAKGPVNIIIDSKSET